MRGAWDGSVRVWSAETGGLIHELKGHRSVERGT